MFKIISSQFDSRNRSRKFSCRSAFPVQGRRLSGRRGRAGNLHQRRRSSQWHSGQAMLLEMLLLLFLCLVLCCCSVVYNCMCLLFLSCLLSVVCVAVVPMFLTCLNILFLFIKNPFIIRVDETEVIKRNFIIEIV